MVACVGKQRMPNTQLEQLLAESGMETQDQHQVRRIFFALTQERQVELLDRRRFERAVANIRASRERVRREQERIVHTLADDLADALASWQARQKSA